MTKAALGPGAPRMGSIAYEKPGKPGDATRETAGNRGTLPISGNRGTLPRGNRKPGETGGRWGNRGTLPILLSMAPAGIVAWLAHAPEKHG